MQTLDYLVLTAYVLGVVGFGCTFVRRSQSIEGFTAAGRRLPGWAVGLSILGTYVSSISFLANPGKSYDADWNPFVFGLSLPIAILIATRWFVPLYRKRAQVSAYSYLEDRFGRWARLYAAVCYMLTQVARTGSIMFLVALALDGIIPWDIRLIIVLTGVLVTLYTLLGGIEAVIWTDVVQSIVLFGGAVATAVVLLVRVPGGPGELLGAAVSNGKFGLGGLGPSLAAPTFWVVMVYGLTMNLQNFAIDQSYVQRYVTAKSDAEATRSVWLGGLLYIPVSALLFFIGTALWCFYQARPELLPPELALPNQGDRIFPHFIVTGLPAGVTGLLIAAVLAAAMSSVDSSLNCSATLILSDFCTSRPGHSRSEGDSMRILRISTIAFGLVGTGVALAMINARSVLDAWWKLSGIFSGGMLGLFLLGFCVARARSATAATATAFGVLVIFWMTFSPKLEGSLAAYRSPFHAFLITVLGTLAIFLAGLALSSLWRPRQDGRGGGVN